MTRPRMASGVAVCTIAFADVSSSNVIAPQATADAVFPAFLMLAAIMLLVALAYVFLGVETHGKPIAMGQIAAE